MNDEEIRERVRLLRRASGGRLRVLPMRVFPNLKPGDELRFGGDCEHGQEPCEHDRVVVVDRVATMTCDGCGFAGSIPAEMMPPVFSALILCPLCQREYV